MIEGFEPVVVDTFGGLCTLVERSDLPIGLSPAAENVEFFPGGVRTRDGFKAYLSDVVTTDQFCASYDHVDGRGTRHHVVYQNGTGKLGSRTSGATINSVIAKLGAPESGLYSTMRAASLYGRVFMCVSDGKRGLAPMFQWDGNLSASTVGATGAHEASIVDDTGGSGVTVDGVYHLVVAFETATGYITGVTKLNYVAVSSGTGRFDITSIPLGPPGTVKRRLFISLPDSFELYNTPTLVLNDNITPQILDYQPTSSEIAAGLPFDSYLNLSPPTAHLGVEAYANRLVTWGGDSRVNHFFGPMSSGPTPVYSSIGLLNLDFSAEAAAAYTFSSGAGTYVEWGVSGVMTAGVVTAGSTTEGETRNYYRITSDGTASCGLIDQGYGLGSYRPNRDVLGNYYLNPGKRYGIRARVRNVDGTNTGNLKIVLYEATSTGPSRTAVATLTVPMASKQSGWYIYESDGSTTVTAQPSVAMSVYIENVPAGKKVDVTGIEVYDVEVKRGHSTLDVSRAFDPESFDAVTGSIQVNPNDGQEIRNVFALRGNLYICKERSLYVTQDNGQEPAFWNVELVSSTVGTPSVHGVGLGDGWAVIASADGLYLFEGGAPQKISQEIQPTWDEFPYEYAERTSVAVNTTDRYCLVNGCTNGTDFKLLRVNFIEGWGSPLADGNGRKWSIDSRVPPSPGVTSFTHATMLSIDAKGMLPALCYSDVSGNGLCHLDKTTTNDFSGYIASTYETAPIGGVMGRSLFGQFAGKIRGYGSLGVYVVRPDGSTSTLIGTETLSTAPNHELEIRMHKFDTQLSVKLYVLGNAHYFRVKRLALWQKPAPFCRLRGY